jgi:hypothetical protein
MRRYPIGIQDFSEVRTGNYLYVDKTPFIEKLFFHEAVQKVMGSLFYFFICLIFSILAI